MTSRFDGDRFIRALSGVPLPAALVDLDALEVNIDRLLAPLRAAGKRVRIASKSVRSPALMQRIAERGGDLVIGYMTASASETAYYAEHGVHDLLLAYPTLQPSDAALVARANRTACAAVVIDDPAQLAPLADAARSASTTIPIVLDIDMSWRPVGPSVHVGVRRSPLREPAEVVALARRVVSHPTLRLHGILGYEAQLAGLPDRTHARRWINPLVRALKRGSQPAVADQRKRLLAALVDADLSPTIVNGGGTGSVAFSCTDPTLTEITIGSGFLAGHLFDRYAGLSLEPALAFALQVTRRPTAGVVTCFGGGWPASGAAGADRLPLPVWPRGATLLAAEGAGEVQTPIALPRGTELALGDTVLFRPAKSGELAERVAEYVLIRGDQIVGRAPTYRGLGHAFLG
ncbi:MAG: alanine racemase [Deltaproteobacteria bacterium]|nr:alanine racemase [Deltaproteobacteria bacterium]